MTLKRNLGRVLTTCVLVGWVGVAQAAPGDAPVEGDGQLEAAEAAEAAAAQREIDALMAGLRFKTGPQKLFGRAMQLDLPPGYQFLSASDAQKVLADLWGNPREAVSHVKGMIVPPNVALDAEDGWAVVLTYDRSGYVSDEDADSIDYDALLGDLKARTAQSNERRAALGATPMTLVGWAVPPTYDRRAKVLHWAKELAYGEDGRTLNFDVRVLGRYGVASMNCVSSMRELPAVQARVEELGRLATFTDGYRYDDFDPDTDETSAGGMAGLIVGGAVATKVAAKVGLLKGAWLALLAFKKWIILGLIGVAGLLRHLWGGGAR